MKSLIVYKSLTILGILVVAHQHVAEARVSPGDCPQVSYMTNNFHPELYSGQWYEIVRDKSNPYTIGADCVTKEYGPFKKENEPSMDLYFRGFYHGK